MATRIVMRKGSSRRLKSTVQSSKQAQRLSKAIKQLGAYDLETLQRAGKVKKLNLSNHDNVYVFRVGLNERIVFSPVNGQNVIHDIVDVKSGQSVDSLTLASQ